MTIVNHKLTANNTDANNHDDEQAAETKITTHCR